MRPYASLMIAAAAAFMSAAPAFAQSEDDVPTLTVSLAGMDLSTREGAAMAMGRISDAASKVCGGKPDLRQLDRVSGYDKCRSAAVAGAVRSLDRPILSRLAAAEPQPVVIAAR